MKFPSKDFPVTTSLYLHFALNSLLILNPRCTFHNVASLFLNITQCPMPLAWKPLLHLLNQFAHCIHPYWDSFCDSFYCFLRERIISHLAIFILWTWLLQVDIFLLMWCSDKNARFQILLHGFDFWCFFEAEIVFLLQCNKNKKLKPQEKQHTK